jgi:hypothetical protein
VITYGRYIIWCTKKDSIKLLAYDNISNKYELLRTLENTSGESRVAISGVTIITGSPGESNSIRVWTMSTDKCEHIATLKIPNDEIIVNLAIEGERIISNTSSGRIIIHNLQDSLGERWKSIALSNIREAEIIERLKANALYEIERLKLESQRVAEEEKKQREEKLREMQEDKERQERQEIERQKREADIKRQAEAAARERRAEAEAYRERQAAERERQAAEREAQLTRFLGDIFKNVNARGENNITPIIYCTLYGSTEYMTIILENGGDVNFQDNNGWTALHYAVNNNDIAKVRLLVSHRAIVNKKNYSGVTPLNMAKSYEVAQILRNGNYD